MALFCGWGNCLRAIQNQYEKTVYVLPEIPRNH